LEMAGIGIVDGLSRKEDLILLLNSGSSSLKFGIYYRGATDEEPNARMHAMEESKSVYSHFLTLWKDADPDIPILKQARAEYAKLD
jgi:acetate kinase